MIQRGKYKVRIIIVFLVFCFLFSVIIARLFLIQIRQQGFFKTLAQQQHELAVTINPPRAAIYDRYSKSLVLNKEDESAFILPRQLEQRAQTEYFLKTEYPEVYARLKAHPEKYFLWLERRIPKERCEALQKREFVDVHFINEFHRWYPYREFAHILGFTNVDSEGIAGIELLCCKQLRGHAATLKLEKDARSGSFYFTKHVEREGKDGEPVTLTIDGPLQTFAYKELEKTVKDYQALGGAVLVLNPDSGEILAMANYPGFDPNAKVASLDVTKNIIVTEVFELGSVIKAFCALAALEEGVVTSDELIDCEGPVAYIDGLRVENVTNILNKVLRENNNVLPFHDVIKYSSNVGVVKVVRRLGTKFYDHLRRLGFGTKTGVQFPGERAGFVNSPEHWSRSSLMVMSFGYEMMASLLQLGRAFSVIANDGYLVEPRLMLSDQKPGVSKRLYKPATTATMKDILEQIGQKYGVKGCRVMGKTGTARCVKDGRYSKTAHNYTFAGIVEKDGYRRVVITFIREPSKAQLWASEVAAPLFHRVAEKMVIHDVMHDRVVLNT